MRHVGTACALAALAACAGGESQPIPDTTWEQRASIERAPILAACGTPTVDGVLSPGEWDGAIPARFTVRSPAGGGIGLPAEVMARSDDQNLYVAFRLRLDPSTYVSDVRVDIDANDSGGEDDGDDSLSYAWTDASGGPASFRDSFRWDCWWSPQYRGLCSSLDTDAWEAGLPSGTSDGGGAIHYGDGEVTLELWHPYHGSDPLDAQRVAGQVLRMMHQFTVQLPCESSAPWDPSCSFTFTGPPGWNPPYLPAGCSAPVPVPQVIEIQIGTPGYPLPTIEIISREPDRLVSATLIGSEAFDVADVDLSTLFFSSAPVARDHSGAPLVRVQDVNGDGIDDLVAQFRTRYLNYWESDRGVAIMSLAGRTKDGHRFHGTNGARELFDPGP